VICAARAISCHAKKILPAKSPRFVPRGADSPPGPFRLRYEAPPREAGIRSVSRDGLDGADMAVNQSPLIFTQKDGIAHAYVNGTNLTLINKNYGDKA
jgi:hypothetical protein